MTNNLLLVSNSKNLLNNKAGKQIDESNFKICRFNLFEIDGYEHCIGSRTDYILARSCSDIPFRNSDSFEHLYLFIAYYELSAAQRAVSKNFIRYYGSNKVTVVDTKFSYSTHRKLGLEYGERASVGILAVDYFVTEGHNVYLYGWDYDISHYFRRQPLDARHHNFLKEQTYLDELRGQRKIKDWMEKI